MIALVGDDILGTVQWVIYFQHLETEKQMPTNFYEVP